MSVRSLFLLALLLVLAACNPSSETASDSPVQRFKGETMGTYYSIIYHGDADYQLAVDSLMLEVNQFLSTYIPSASISVFNQNDSFLVVPKSAPEHFSRVFDKAKAIYKETNGAFDPTVMPLVNYWGFGYTKKESQSPDKTVIDSLIRLVGFEKVTVSEATSPVDPHTTIPSGEFIYRKTDAKIQLDFSAIAKGYGVDQIGLLLESKEIQNYFVEIGGEVRTKGKSRPDKDWTVGISTPMENAKVQDLHTAIRLKNKSIASSGNYRNFYEKDGVKYAHTINPLTGYPELNPLLSASVIANDCMSADAYATACMVLGLEKAFDLIEKNDGLEGLFIYSDDKGVLKTKTTAGMDQYLLKN